MKLHPVSQLHGLGAAPRRQGAFVAVALVSLALASAVAASGCAFCPFLPATGAALNSTLGDTLRLRDPAQSVDLSVRVTKTKVIREPGAPPNANVPNWLGVHLTVRNLSSMPYQDAHFDACSALVDSHGLFGAVSGTAMPVHTLQSSVTIAPSATLRGWVWFWIEGKQPVEGAEGLADFNTAHVFSFCPADNGSSVRGLWELKP
jgi:hypothetical protein